MFIETCNGAENTSGENFCPPDPNVAGAVGPMLMVRSKDVSSTRSTPPKRIVASTTANGESVVATGAGNIGDAPVASAWICPVPVPEGSAVKRLFAEDIENLMPPQMKSCTTVDSSISPSYSSTLQYD